MKKSIEQLTLVNSFFGVVSETGKLYYVTMSFDDAHKFANFYNSTIHDEGNFSVKEISLNDIICIKGEFAK